MIIIYQEKSIEGVVRIKQEITDALVQKTLTIQLKK